MRYLIPTGSKPIYIASQGGADAALNIGAEFEDRDVDIHNARTLETSATLDREGFELRKQTTAIEDFYQIEKVQEEYDKEVIALVLSATGAQEAIVFDHTLRSDSREIRGVQNTREPASVIHNDYTDNSAKKRLTDLLPTNEAESRLQKRFAIVNVWRSVSGDILDSALACCDARSLADENLIASERRAAERVGELQLVSWNAAHRWFYFPRMQRDETLLIKTFDSAVDGRARRCVHTAFHDPTAPADVPPRESIESRLLVFFD
ncbi:MAG: CmcJ/NvfI family oxidoreductase [Halieaceae bacterium]